MKFFLVLEGRLEFEVQGREAFVLGPDQGVTISRGIVHRPHAHGRTLVLMVEPATVMPTGNDWREMRVRRGLRRRASFRGLPPCADLLPSTEGVERLGRGLSD